jgi:hypothetical protein
MSRLDTIKRVGFPEEECPKCHGDCDQCEVCNDTGVFKQRLKNNWSHPELQPGQSLVAYLDVNEWSFFGIVDSEGEIVAELDFPFTRDFATGKHFQTLGFRVEQ